MLQTNALAISIAVLAYPRLPMLFGDVPYTEGGKGKSNKIFCLPNMITQRTFIKI